HPGFNTHLANHLQNFFTTKVFSYEKPSGKQHAETRYHADESIHMPESPAGCVCCCCRFS
ncbi:hypothetical protein RA276_29045, partial [Pseudomonas syringae pv. tagetis]|uniref:hypothetical protein n=1 Tax=Pseudomonas syringae group genomosp. 7 TaxID=251699 RepID=UPI00377022E4